MLHTLFLVRHGQTEWNAQERLQGQLDSGLTELGKRQADENGRLLGRYPIDRVLVSPLGRTTETAHIINSYVHADLEYHDALLERHCGEWSGLSYGELKMQQPLAWQARAQDPWNHSPPGGENLPAVVARVAPLLDDLVDSGGECVAIISHGIVGKAILAHYLGLSPAEAVAVRQPNDVAYSLEFAANGSIHCEYFRRGEGPLRGVVETA